MTIGFLGPDSPLFYPTLGAALATLVFIFLLAPRNLVWRVCQVIGLLLCLGMVVAQLMKLLGSRGQVVGLALILLLLVGGLAGIGWCNGWFRPGFRRGEWRSRGSEQAEGERRDRS